MIVIEANILGRIITFVVGCFIATTAGYISFIIATDREFRPSYDGFISSCIVLAFIIGITILGVCIMLWSLGWIVVK